MADTSRLAKATLSILDAQWRDPTERVLAVQFNPESLKVSYANQVKEPKGGTDKRGGSSLQFVGTGTTKLSVQLWFDVTGDLPEEYRGTTDVRTLTGKVIRFITPIDNGGGNYVVPALRFEWGSFVFDGIVDGIEENLEFFSPDGTPLRANMSLSASSQRILPPTPKSSATGASPPGTRRLTSPTAGVSLQDLAGEGDWRAMAARNGIDNPRSLPTRGLLDLGR